MLLTNAFHRTLWESGDKPNELLVDKGSEVYNKSIKTWLKTNGLELSWIHDEGKYDFNFIKLLNYIIF